MFTVTLNFTDSTSRLWGKVEAASAADAVAKVRSILRSMKALKGMGLASIVAE